ncbi:hypothetical protein HN011_002047, partial [Eciton burchellii]
SLANDGVQWHFIPPTTPYFGRLWEAGVKVLSFICGELSVLARSARPNLRRYYARLRHA